MFTIRSSQAGNSNYNAAPDVDQSFTVNSGALDHFSFAVIGTQTAGTPFNVTITAQDVDNNTVTGYVGTVDLTTTAGTIAPLESSVFSSGVRTESVTVTTVGELQTITATDNGGTKTGTSNTFTVNAGALDHFTFDAISTQAAGAPFNITITAQNVTLAPGGIITTYGRGYAGSTTPTTAGAGPGGGGGTSAGGGIVRVRAAAILQRICLTIRQCQTLSTFKLLAGGSLCWP